MVNQEQALEALMLEIASHELRLVPSMRAKLDDFGKLSKEILELVEKHSKEKLTHGELFQLFYMLSKQMFRTESIAHPQFKQSCEYLLAYFAVKDMQEWERMSAEIDIQKQWDKAMEESPTSVKIKLPNAEDYKKVPCVCCGKPLSECKCSLKKVECTTCGLPLNECKCTQGYG